MKKIMVVLMVMVMCSGCMSVGRFALVDLDLRTPEQIAAYSHEAEIPYMVPDNSNTMKVGQVAQTIWEQVLEVLKVVKGRLRVVSVEWRK